ncbi:MAG: hypothetical protein KC561_00885, partial [Myxococcales bacterium]|nr:hypothetical protein [Myxococcales bacterium]
QGLNVAVNRANEWSVGFLPASLLDWRVFRLDAEDGAVAMDTVRAAPQRFFFFYDDPDSVTETPTVTISQEAGVAPPPRVLSYGGTAGNLGLEFVAPTAPENTVLGAPTHINAYIYADDEGPWVCWESDSCDYPCGFNGNEICHLQGAGTYALVPELPDREQYVVESFDLSTLTNRRFTMPFSAGTEVLLAFTWSYDDGSVRYEGMTSRPTFYTVPGALASAGRSCATAFDGSTTEPNLMLRTGELTWYRFVASVDGYGIAYSGLDEITNGFTTAYTECGSEPLETAGLTLAPLVFPIIQGEDYYLQSSGFADGVTYFFIEELAADDMTTEVTASLAEGGSAVDVRWDRVEELPGRLLGSAEMPDGFFHYRVTRRHNYDPAHPETPATEEVVLTTVQDMTTFPQYRDATAPIGVPVSYCVEVGFPLDVTATTDAALGNPVCSAPVTATTPRSVQQLQPPANLRTYFGPGISRVVHGPLLSWDRVDGANSYEITEEAPDGTVSVYEVRGGRRSFASVASQLGEYEYEVRALNDSPDRIPSAAATITWDSCETALDLIGWQEPAFAIRGGSYTIPERRPNWAPVDSGNFFRIETIGVPTPGDNTFWVQVGDDRERVAAWQGTSCADAAFMGEALPDFSGRNTVLTFQGQPMSSVWVRINREPEPFADIFDSIFAQVFPTRQLEQSSLSAAWGNGQGTFQVDAADIWIDVLSACDRDLTYQVVVEAPVDQTSPLNFLGLVFPNLFNGTPFVIQPSLLPGGVWRSEVQTMHIPEDQPGAPVVIWLADPRLENYTPGGQSGEGLPDDDIDDDILDGSPQYLDVFYPVGIVTGDANNDCEVEITDLRRLVNSILCAPMGLPAEAQAFCDGALKVLNEDALLELIPGSSELNIGLALALAQRILDNMRPQP